MNRPPEIIVNSGFVTDQNGVLTEMVIPSSVITQNIPSIITTYATTINWIPSNAATLVEFDALNLQSINSKLFGGYTKLSSVNMPALTSMSCNGSNAPFEGCTSLTSVNMPSLTSINLQSTNHGIFRGCTALSEITLPSLESITTNTISASGGTFYGCSNLVTVNMPKIKTIIDQGNSYNATFLGCTSLKSVTLGSTGNPVTSLSGAFYRCTQSGLTITIYTQGGAALSGEPWGATNATIEYEEA